MMALEEENVSSRSATYILSKVDSTHGHDAKTLNINTKQTLNNRI